MIKNIKALVVDIDGTLVEKGDHIMPETYEALCFLHKKGVLLGLASGRPVDDYVRGLYKFWNLPFDFDVYIGMNGGHLWDRFHSDEVTNFYPLSIDSIKTIQGMVAPLDMNAQIYENNQLIAQRWDDRVAASAIRNMQEVVISPFLDRMYRRPNAKIQFRYPFEQHEEVLSFVNKLTLPEHIRYVLTSAGIIEFMDDRVNKGIALTEFAKRNNIAIEETMAFGDMQNDTELVHDAGWGVCLLNGCDETKATANDITEYSVSEDGMGRYLKKHVIGKII